MEERPDVLAPRFTPTGMPMRPDVLAPLPSPLVMAGAPPLVFHALPDPVPKSAEDPIARRAGMVAWAGDLPEETNDAITQVRLLSSRYAWELQAVFKRAKVDVGRAIAALDQVQQAQHVAVDALVLPHVSKRSE